MHIKNQVFISVLLCILASVLPACGSGICTPSKPNTHVTLSQFKGQFGNQVLQYIFLKVYAKRHGLQAQTTGWDGARLFGLNDSRICNHYDVLEESPEVQERIKDSYTLRSQERFSDVDFRGYFQFHTSLHANDRDYVMSLFQPVPEYKNRVQQAVQQLRALGNTLVSIHLRRGDFGTPPFHISPSTWYLQWLREIWPTLNHPVLFVASDSLDLVLGDFAEFRPVTIRDLGVEIKFAGYYPEYYILTQSDILAASNSTFSTTAALLNSTGRAFYRPDFAQGRLVEFDPWNTHPFEYVNR